MSKCYWKYIFLLFLLIVTCFAFATIYKSVAPNGSMVFSDTPIPNSKPIIVSQINIANTSTTNAATTLTATDSNSSGITSASTTTGTADPTQAATSTNYTEISITSPANETTFQNQQSITVTVEIKPDLAKEDNIQLILDGAPYGNPEHSLSLTINNLTRGTHQVQAVIIDANQTRQKVSQAVTFYIHQPSQLLKAI